MSDIQFDEPTYSNRAPQQRDSLPTRLVLKMGVSRKQAPMALIGIAVAVVAIMLFVGFGGGAEQLPDDGLGQEVASPSN